MSTGAPRFVASLLLAGAITFAAAAGCSLSALAPSTGGSGGMTGTGSGGAPASCMDGVKDDGETDVDCGGSCPSCADGKSCAKDADCLQASYCDAQDKCAPKAGNGTSEPGAYSLSKVSAVKPTSVKPSCWATSTA